MKPRGIALAATGLVLSLGGGAAAQPVSGLYVGAGAGANWLVGAKGNVVGQNPADLIAQSFGAPNAAAVQNAAAAAQQGAAAAQTAARQVAGQAAAAQAAAQAALANPLLTAAQRAATQNAAAAAQTAAQQAAAQSAAAQVAAQRAQAAAGAVNSAQGLGRTAKISFDVGFAGVASLGWGFGNGLRAEVEGNFRTNEVGKVRLLGLAADVAGQARSYGVMANLFYDFDPGFFGLGPSYVQPYLGLGAGYIVTQYHRLRASAGGFSATLDDTDGRFGGQAIAGVAVPLTWLGVPGLSLTAEYRFLATEQPRVRADLRLGGASGPVLLSRNFGTANFDHSALLGVRYAFNQPRPAPPLAPAPAPAPVAQDARTYLVFFDWDRADLTARARQIVAEAAQASTRVQSTRIEINGYTDLSGTARYNQDLSVRRGNAVAAELVRDGVPRSEIVTRGFGESNPLVPTAQGVREPQNRRVEIILR